MGSDICLPVAKYSHAVGIRENKTVPWNHVASSNLFIVVKGTDKAMKDEKLTLSIVQANEVLESLDVSSYVDKAIKVRRSVQDTGTTLYMEQLPIFGITKETILALRYTLLDGQSRRLQMRMHSASECRQIVHAFESRGMEFTEQRPDTARPSTARPLTTGSQVTAHQPSSSYFPTASHTTQHPFACRTIEAGSMSQRHRIIPEQGFANFDSAAQQIDATSHSMPPPPTKLLTRNEEFAHREVAPSRPSTAQIYRSHSNYPQRTPFDAHDIVHQAHKDGLVRPSSTSNTAPADAIDQTVEQLQSPRRSTLTTHASDLSFPDPDSGAVQPGTHSRAFDSSSTVRPATTSSSVFPETLEHEIPPRRLLPFARPDSGQTGKASPRSRSALTLPPLPKPRLSLQNSESSAGGRHSAPIPASLNRPHTSSPLKRSFADMEEQSVGAVRPSTASPRKTISPVRVPSPQAPAKKPSPMEELLKNRKASLEKSAAGNAKRMDSLADAPGEEDDSLHTNDRSPSKLSSRHDSVSPVRCTNDVEDATVNAYAAIRSTLGQQDSLEQYAQQSLQDRQAALDEFMVQNLENPAFTRLCKDVENCWRRIALGL